MKKTEETIRKRYDAEEGLWHVDLFTHDVWISVSANCQEVDADSIIWDMKEWKAGK